MLKALQNNAHRVLVGMTDTELEIGRWVHR